MASRCPSPRLGSRCPLAARGKRVAPESCRAGHLRASSPLRSAVRHGLVGTRLAPPRNWPRAAASRRFPPFPARTGPTQARTAGLSLRPLRPLAAAGPARASIPRLGARMRRMPAGLRPHRPAVRRSARIRSPHASESARSAPRPRGLRRLRSRPRRPTRRFSATRQLAASGPLRSAYAAPKSLDIIICFTLLCETWLKSVFHPDAKRCGEPGAEPPPPTRRVPAGRRLGARNSEARGLPRGRRPSRRDAGRRRRRTRARLVSARGPGGEPCARLARVPAPAEFRTQDRAAKAGGAEALR